MLSRKQTAKPNKSQPAGAIPVFLQRKCACGGSAGSNGKCEKCKKKDEAIVKRSVVGHADLSEAYAGPHEGLSSANQPSIPGTLAFEEPLLAHDFSRVTVNPAPQTANASTEGGNAPSPQFLPAGPRPADRATPSGPAAKPGKADLYITVRQPAKITSAQILAKGPMDAPNSGLDFRLSHRAKFKQDEYVVGNLRWNQVGKGVPASKQEEEFGTFTHSWTSETEDRPDLPGNPTMLKAFDTHTYGLAVVPGSDCEEAAKKHTPPFDRLNNDWTYTEHGKFVDTVTFADKETKRVYYFDYRSQKRGSSITADVEYSNVDKVEKV